MAAPDKEDHRHADSFGWQRPRLDYHSLSALGAAGKVLVKEKFTQRQLPAYTPTCKPH